MPSLKKPGLRRLLSAGLLLSIGSLMATAAELQGVVVDWNCVKPMVKNGREKTLRQRRSCSMVKNYNRSAYGLITDGQKFYRLEDPGNAKIKQLLKNTPDRDNLKVVVSGEVEGGTVKVDTISFL